MNIEQRCYETSIRRIDLLVEALSFVYKTLVENEVGSRESRSDPSLSHIQPRLVDRL